MKYRVTKMCFHGGARYREGSIVDLSDGASLPKWFVPVNASDKPEVKGKWTYEHKGHGKYDVTDDKGEVVDSGLTKMEAQAKVAEAGA